MISDCFFLIVQECMTDCFNRNIERLSEPVTRKSKITFKMMNITWNLFLQSSKKYECYNYPRLNQNSIGI